jgi:hypothetical protein|tara:strand:- start:3556 stop:6933 length:3378 start_codon:yes stop_codon:yes gene_type:complete
MALTKLDKNLLGFSDDTDFVKLPSGTTAQRPGSPAAGQFRFNTTINDAEVYDGTAWQRMGVAPPTFSSVDYPGDDTALDPAGDQSLIINGGTFNTGVTVTIGGTTPSSITRNSATQLTVTTPAKSAGTYALVITNTDGGTSTSANAVSYNGIPAFTNAAGSLGSVEEGSTVNLSAAATEPDGGAIGYTITSGALPTGLSINASTGAITGTAGAVSADTTSNFTVTATDNENQSTSRAYSITVTNAGPETLFKTVAWTGNGQAGRAVTVGFKPDLVWVKSTTHANSWVVQDSTRGVNSLVSLNTNGTELDSTWRGNYGQIASFTTTGFTVNAGSQSSGNFNSSGHTYIAYCWKANGGTTSTNSDGSTNTEIQGNSDLGLNIVKFTASGGGGQTWGHGLGVVPDLIILKVYTNETNNWQVWTPAIGNKAYLTLDTTNARVSRDDSFSSVTKDTVTNSWTSANADRIAYCFKSMPGVSKIGTYEGNGSAEGPIVNTGFEPQFLMIKNIDGTEGGGASWLIYDNNRSSANPRTKRLWANDSAASATYYQYAVDFFSNGFQIANYNSNWGHNNNGENYLYVAFGANADTTTPALANSFDALTWTGDSSAKTINNGFKTGLLWTKARNVSHHWGIWDIVRGPREWLIANENSDNDIGNYGVEEFNATSTKLYGSFSPSNTTGSNYIGWFWKAHSNEPTLTQLTAAASARVIYNLNANANDSTGTVNATASGITYSAGKFGNAATYSGTNASSGSKIYAANSIYGSSTTVFTVSLWIKMNNTTGEIPLAGNGGTIGGTHGYAVYAENGRLALTFRNSNGSQEFHYGPNINNNEWRHVALTLDNGPWVLYLDGREVKRGVTNNYVNNLTPSFDTYFGNRWNRNENGVISGQMDQIRIYDKALTSSAITELYTETTSENDTQAIGTPYPTSTESVVSANNNAGFSVVKWDQLGGNDVIVPHGLTSAPEWIITKAITDNDNWFVYHTSMGTGKLVYLNLNNSMATDANGYSAVGATTFTSRLSNSDVSMISYCWAPKSNYSNFGTYTGDGNAGKAITTGFQPDLIITKDIDNADNWRAYDSARGFNYPIYPSSSVIEDNNSNGVSGVTSTGFTLGNGNLSNRSGADYIYAAFKIN